MDYVDGFVIPVKTADREVYLAHVRMTAAVFRDCGALRVVETWGDDVPDGKLTSFPMAIKREADETVVFTWIVWPSRAVRDEGWKTAMTDPRMNTGAPAPFDARRIIYGGFRVILDTDADAPPS